MFYSPPPYHDLIFQDATRQLQTIEPKDRWFSDYLGPDFMRAKRITDCDAGAMNLRMVPSIILLTLGTVVWLVN